MIRTEAEKNHDSDEIDRIAFLIYKLLREEAKSPAIAVVSIIKVHAVIFKESSIDPNDPEGYAKELGYQFVQLSKTIIEVADKEDTESLH